jgi:hypothetical protein
MTIAALAFFAIGCALIGCSLVAWWLMLLPTNETIHGVVRLFYDRWSLAFGLFALAVGVACWTRAWVRLPRVLPPLAMLLGIVLITVTGYREVHAPATAAPQVSHALIGLGAITLTLLGLIAAPRAFGPVAELFALDRRAFRLAKTPDRRLSRLGSWNPRPVRPAALRRRDPCGVVPAHRCGGGTGLRPAALRDRGGIARVSRHGAPSTLLRSRLPRLRISETEKRMLPGMRPTCVRCDA